MKSCTMISVMCLLRYLHRKGLVVPVIRNAESLSFNQVESEVVRLAKKARDNKLSIDEMQGGTFTVTNGGIFGSMLIYSNHQRTTVCYPWACTILWSDQ